MTQLPECGHTGWPHTCLASTWQPQRLVVCLLNDQQIQIRSILFPKFFAFFPQGTCVISVSWLYSVLCETYHMICTSFPKSVTPQIKATCKHSKCCKGLSPSLQFHSKKHDTWIPLANRFTIHVRSKSP